MPGSEILTNFFREKIFNNIDRSKFYYRDAIFKRFE